MISAQDLARLPKARLNKAKTHVVCARPECGRRLLIRELDLDGVAWLWVLQGWVLDDVTNIIRTTKRGREREAVGRTPTYRRQPHPMSVLRSGPGARRHFEKGPHPELVHVERLPGVIICPDHAAGGLRQVADSEMLLCPVYIRTMC